MYGRSRMRVALFLVELPNSYVFPPNLQKLIKLLSIPTPKEMKCDIMTTVFYVESCSAFCRLEQAISRCYTSNGQSGTNRKQKDGRLNIHVSLLCGKW